MEFPCSDSFNSPRFNIPDKMIKEFNEFLKKRTVKFTFMLISLIGGFCFIEYGLTGITGNTIASAENTFNLLSFVGLLLIICSVVIGIETLSRKK